MNKPAANPKDTFLNLSESKRGIIISAMVHEFALNGYRKASMNAVVKKAGISKGSLYQYFSSKEDIFLFVFDQFTTLVKSAVISESEKLKGTGAAFWDEVKSVLVAGVGFIDSYPVYFQLYMRVLFEHDLPQREALLTRVRLFSKEYFTPLIQLARKEGVLRSDISFEMVLFTLDAMLDRFLQGYSESYLDGSLRLTEKSGPQLNGVIDEIITILQDGLSIQGD